LAPGARFVSLPPKRILTQLKADNATSFVDDFRERNVDGYGRSVVVLGIDFDASECVRFPTGLQAALRAFVASEAEPLRLVMLQLGDSAEFVFVPRPPIEPVRSLLEFLGLNRSASIRISDYGKLGQLRLESSIDQYVALCFGPQSVAKPRSPE
jgi:hypothetical protein